MHIVNGIKSFFGKTRTKPDVNFETLASLPIYQMMKEVTPFDNWRPADTEIPDELAESFKVYTWLYQIYVFYALIGARYGKEIADRVLRLQAERLNKIPGGLGNDLDTAIKQIHTTVVRTEGKPQTLHVNGKDVCLPIEYGIALDFLILAQDSPFYVDREIFSDSIPEMNGADFALCECLEHGKQSALEYFQPLLDEVRVVL